ncbi:hypothetical protein PCANC_27649 [Puccinia coronata f. sp. avenae]|uniref:Mur ligase central domain-containing protein n=1 Tax=Puccinia coronata f. sp. avenae TaxID=200324 RepID=A0A2N5RZ77_9BASI|nr:hypothetical protein PCANC_27649 [Puccinia coronata f. sp. avenae]
MGGNIRLGLSRVRQALHHLNNPHLRIPIIHVAGTNGKGSVCAFETEILGRAGFRVGRFTSPFLLHPADSISLDGHGIDLDQQAFEEATHHVQESARQNHISLTSFELLTITAFHLFASPRYKLDLAVVEVGLGGLKDSTNVCLSGNTLLSCITPISIDHQAFLGSSISEIAAHKAGIAKPNVPILLAQQAFPDQVHEIVREKASYKSCDVFTVRPYPIPHPASTQSLPPLPLMPLEEEALSSSASSSLCTSHRNNRTRHASETIPNPLSPTVGLQHQNAATASTLAHILRTHPHPLKLLPLLSKKLTDDAILQGIQNTKWQGRLEFVDYQHAHLLLDGAHNVAAAELLGDHLLSLNRPITLIMALSSPRNPTEIIHALDLGRMSCPAQLVCTTFSIPKDMEWVQPVSPELIAKSFRRLLPPPSSNDTAVHVHHNPEDALSHAISISRAENELIVQKPCNLKYVQVAYWTVSTNEILMSASDKKARRSYLRVGKRSPHNNITWC